MSLLFEELDYRPTPIGALSLRRRRELKLGVDVFEIKLGEEFLMSSLFTASEIALANLGLKMLSGDRLDVVVGDQAVVPFSAYQAKEIASQFVDATLTLSDDGLVLRQSGGEIVCRRVG